MNELIEQVKNLYLSDKRVISLGFSGGKDSSLCVVILLEALLKICKKDLQKEVYILYSDTLVELLPVQQHTYKVIENIKRFVEENHLPVKVLHAMPEMSETMWSMLIGKGMRPPSSDQRWCTTRLKTDVQEKILHDVFGSKDIVTISIVGSRKDESANRAKRLIDNTLDGHLKEHMVYKKSLVFAPIEDYSEDDVWVQLKGSTIGKKVLDVDTLWELYATTNGKGEECQTILGNANEHGINPGCSKSGGRFGCWNCSLLPKGGDKALHGMLIKYPYIQYLIDFRDYVVGLRDGNWHLYRDYYNHGDGTRLQYSYDNERFGMTCPGGLNLSTRGELLNRLLETETQVRKFEPSMQLISDEELDFIQQEWVEEGDLDLSAKAIAEKFGRKITVSSVIQKNIAYAKLLSSTQSMWEGRVFYWFNIQPNERFAMQFVMQMTQKHGPNAFMDVMVRLLDDPRCIADALLTLQLRNQFFPNESLKKVIYKEWLEDKIGYLTQRLLCENEGTEVDEKVSNCVSVSGQDFYDPFDDPSISMADKYAMLDNWNWYQDHDIFERIEHPEYSRYKGNCNYIKFRGRLQKGYTKMKHIEPSLFTSEVA